MKNSEVHIDPCLLHKAAVRWGAEVVDTVREAPVTRTIMYVSHDERKGHSAETHPTLATHTSEQKGGWVRMPNPAAGGEPGVNAD